MMKSVGARWPWWYGAAVLCGGMAFGLVELVSAQSTNPVLTISLVSSNQVKLTITNAVPGQTYEIHRRPVFHEEYPWQLHLVGTNASQTNFTAPMGIDLSGFFRAQLGTDADGDGIFDRLDANPTNASVSTLFITIDNPTNGFVIQ